MSGDERTGLETSEAQGTGVGVGGLMSFAATSSNAYVQIAAMVLATFLIAWYAHLRTKAKTG